MGINTTINAFLSAIYSNALHNAFPIKLFLLLSLVVVVVVVVFL